MIDHNLKFLILALVFNNRLKTYKTYIQLAQENGYEICTMEQFFSSYKSPSKHFVLRHDVDHRGRATRRMFKIEKELGIKSTYYFRFSTINMSLIREMSKAGFDIGLHYETLADYANENRITNISEVNFDIVEQRLKEDILRFEKITGIKISSICSHGAPKNTQLGYSNNKMLDNKDIKEFGVLFEAYDKDMYSHVDCHIMDCRLIDNYGFSYRDNPMDAIASKLQNIIFLSHPNHWWIPWPKRMRYLGLVVLGKSSYSTCRVFHRI